MVPAGLSPGHIGTVCYVNARLFDPGQDLDVKGGIRVTNGIINSLGPKITAKSRPANEQIVDCKGRLLLPGLVDMRVFAGEPGFEYKETLATATESAAAGGVTTIITMPNTDPVIDDAALVDFVLRRARDTGIVRVAPMAALTKGLAGHEMTEFGLLREAGAVAVTDGIQSVANARVLRRAMAYARDFGLPIVQHVEDADLALNGVMNEGELSTRLGLPGIPSMAELIVLERDLRLVELTGANYHASQISSRAAVEATRTAKKNGLPVTCGVSINHLSLNENDIGSYRTFFKLSPPLRSEEDRKALVEGVEDGTIDVIVSGHDPENPDTKRLTFDEAAFGAIGLETLLAAAHGLHLNENIPMETLITAMTRTPARILGLEAGALTEGAPADFSLFDEKIAWAVEEWGLKSKSNNTPFEDRLMQGRVVRTVVAGQTAYELDAQ
ncbi:MAG: amidohydrolase family protein [Alphaproteobacteria bacterium]|nr:amidohydrolase family protein [Alphaproteobacteria bacterium]